MVKVEVIEGFSLARFNEIQNLVRANRDNEGHLYIGDVFDCSDDLAEYLTKTNARGRAFVKVLEVIPEKVEVKEEKVIEEKPKRRTRTTKKTIAKD